MFNSYGNSHKVMRNTHIDKGRGSSFKSGAKHSMLSDIAFDRLSSDFFAEEQRKFHFP